ncbi:hypothetical protein PR048_003755 [Dryococelus australis]|uniref:Uncharacterized protein n=1 Tax=Dryococelus australis TaxID=614101 RepID=A0ABQ9IP21_9NEOP|nr:hypothetical protein PR048_003755 [Dryococelus australis]
MVRDDVGCCNVRRECVQMTGTNVLGLRHAWHQIRNTFTVTFQTGPNSDCNQLVANSERKKCGGDGDAIASNTLCAVTLLCVTSVAIAVAPREEKYWYRQTSGCFPTAMLKERYHMAVVHPSVRRKLKFEIYSTRLADRKRKLPTDWWKITCSTDVRVIDGEMVHHPHCHGNVRLLLHGTFVSRWICRRGSVDFPPRFPDLKHWNFYERGTLKNTACTTNAQTPDAMGETIVTIFSTTKELESLSVPEAPAVLLAVSKENHVLHKTATQFQTAEQVLSSSPHDMEIDVNMEQHWRPPRKFVDQRNRPARFPHAKIRDELPIFSATENISCVGLYASTCHRPIGPGYAGHASYTLCLADCFASVLSTTLCRDTAPLHLMSASETPQRACCNGRSPLPTLLPSASTLLNAFTLMTRGQNDQLVNGLMDRDRRVLTRTRKTEFWMEQRRNARAGEMGEPRENPPTRSIVWHESHTCGNPGTGETNPGSPGVGGEQSNHYANPTARKTWLCKIGNRTSLDRCMNKGTRPVAMLILHKAEEYTTCIQVDVKQDFQKRSLDREQPIQMWTYHRTSSEDGVFFLHGHSPSRRYFTIQGPVNVCARSAIAAGIRASVPPVMAFPTSYCQSSYQVHAALREHYTPVDSLARSDDGALAARASVTLIAPALLGQERRKTMRSGGSLNPLNIENLFRGDCPETVGVRMRKEPMELRAQLLRQVEFIPRRAGTHFEDGTPTRNPQFRGICPSSFHLFADPLLANTASDLHSRRPAGPSELPRVPFVRSRFKTIGATVLQWSDYSPPTKVKRVRVLAGPLLDFRSWKFCRTMALAGRVFLGDIPYPPPLHSGAAPYPPHFALIGSQDVDINSGMDPPPPPVKGQEVRDRYGRH